MLLSCRPTLHRSIRLLLSTVWQPCPPNLRLVTEMPPKRKKTTTAEKSNSTKRSKVESEKSIESDEIDVSDEKKSSDKKSNGKNVTMKIISWNVNGVRAVLKNKALDYLQAESCDILCLQETKCNQKNFPTDLGDWDEFPHKYYAVSQQDGYAGVALLSKIKPDSVQYGLSKKSHDTEGRVITAFYDKFILVNTYTPNAGRGLKRLDYRMEWDEDFRNYLKELDKQKPVIVCGDLNVAHEEIDIANPKSNVKNAGFTPEERANFTTLLETGFIDSFRSLYPDKAQSYTFWSYMRNARAKNIGWRLDYFVTSSRLRDSISDSEIRSDVMGSDHCPIVLSLHNL